MVLTNEGEALFAALEPLYQAMDKSIRAVKESSDSPIKILRIMEPTAFDYSEDFVSLKEIVREYERLYPNVVLDEHLCDFSDMRQALEFGNADVAITEDFVIRDMSNVSSRRLAKCWMYIAISSKHPLAQSEVLNLDALRNEILYTIPTMADPQLDIEAQLNACRNLGFVPKKVEFKQNFQTITHTVSLGRGFSICAKFVNLGFGHDIKYYPIELEIMPYICAVWRTGRLSREAKNFIDMLPEISE